MGQLDGKIAIVTGRRIRHRALHGDAVAEEGAKVLLADWDEAKGNDAAGEITGYADEAIS